MATQVILLERIEKLGDMGEVVNVKPGYARNYLLPQRKALRASKENLAYFEAQKKQLEAENEKRRKEAEKLAKKLDGLKVPLIRQASESGQLYGSVTSRDIAAEASTVAKETIGRAMVQLNQNFKSIGLFPVTLMLHPEVKVEITVNIARTLEEAEIQAETGKALVTDEGESLAEVVAEAEADEEQLEGVLEEEALEAEKQKIAAKKAQAEAEAAEAEAKAEEEAAAKEAQADAETEAAEDAAKEDAEADPEKDGEKDA